MSTDMRVSTMTHPREVTWEISYYGVCMSRMGPSFLADFDAENSTEEFTHTIDGEIELAFADWANLKWHHVDAENTVPDMLWNLIQMQSGRILDEQSIACIMELYDLFMTYFDPHPQFIRGEFHDFLCRAKGRAVVFFG